jgi:hypothetical protein
MSYSRKPAAPTLLFEAPEQKAFKDINACIKTNIDEQIVIDHGVAQLQPLAYVAAGCDQRVLDGGVGVDDAVTMYYSVWTEFYAPVEAAIRTDVERRDQLDHRINDNVSREPYARLALGAIDHQIIQFSVQQLRLSIQQGCGRGSIDPIGCCDYSG